jgi:hypothetical protein
MPRFVPALLLALAAAACSPTFNWREIAVDSTTLHAMLPCKPDKASRKMPMGGTAVEIDMLGCETGGATFAVLHVDLQDPSRADQVLVQWNRATLANLQGTVTASQAFTPRGATPLPGSQRVSAAGKRQDGSAVQGEAAYFARGSQVFQAVVYASEPRPEWLQPFFDGLRFE